MNSVELKKIVKELVIDPLLDDRSTITDESMLWNSLRILAEQELQRCQSKYHERRPAWEAFHEAKAELSR